MVFIIVLPYEIFFLFFIRFLDFHEECALEAFKLKDANRTGYITALDFQDIMLNVKGHLLTSAAKDSLLQVFNFNIGIFD